MPTVDVGTPVNVYLLTPITNEDDTEIFYVHGPLLSMGERGVVLGRELEHPTLFVPNHNIAYIKVVEK